MKVENDCADTIEDAQRVTSFRSNESHSNHRPFHSVSNTSGSAVMFDESTMNDVKELGKSEWNKPSGTELQLVRISDISVSVGLVRDVSAASRDHETKVEL